MVINITEEHIAKGVRGDCGRCPVALAMKAAFGPAVRIRVSVFDYEVHSITRELPEKARRFIHNFDQGTEVQPFSFEI